MHLCVVLLCFLVAATKKFRLSALHSSHLCTIVLFPEESARWKRIRSFRSAFSVLLETRELGCGACSCYREWRRRRGVLSLSLSLSVLRSWCRLSRFSLPESFKISLVWGCFSFSIVSVSMDQSNGNHVHDGAKKNRIQVSNTKKPLFFYVNLAKVTTVSFFLALSLSPRFSCFSDSGIFFMLLGLTSANARASVASLT